MVCKDLECKCWDSLHTLRKMPLSEAALPTCLTQVVGSTIITQDLSHLPLCDGLVPRTTATPYLIGKMGSYCEFPTPKQPCLELDCCQGYSDPSLRFACHIYHAQHFVAFFFLISVEIPSDRLRQTEPNCGRKHRQLLIIINPRILERFLPRSLYDYSFPSTGNVVLQS